MLYGHRNDPAGFAKCLEEFDITLGKIIEKLKETDLLILTADHGNDPTDDSSDHSREYVPITLTSSEIEPKDLGDTDGLMSVGASVASYIGTEWHSGSVLI